jgi:hypothetical protein
VADSLVILRRLRALEADRARRDLAASLSAERAAEGAVLQTEAALKHESQGPATDAANPLAGAYAAWRPVGLAARHAAMERHHQSQISTAANRELLAAVRAAERAVEIVLENRAADRGRLQQQHQQLLLDDFRKR